MAVLRYELPDPRAGGPRAVVLAAPGARAAFGRGTMCEVVLDSAKIGRRHCDVVRHAGDRRILVDGASVNGTLLDGKRVVGEARVRDGAVIDLAGELEVTVRLAEPVPGDPLPGWSLVAIDGVVGRLAGLDDEAESAYQIVSDPPSLTPYRYSRNVRALLRALTRSGLVDAGFDWPAWQDEAAGWIADPDRVAEADLTTLRRLVTSLVRVERLQAGALASRIESGHVAAVLRRLGDLRDESAAVRVAALGDAGPLQHLVAVLYALGRVEHRLGVGGLVGEVPFPGGRRIIGTGTDRWELDGGAAALVSMLAPGGPQVEVTMPGGASAGVDARDVAYDLPSGGAPPPWSAAADGLVDLREGGLVALMVLDVPGTRAVADLRTGRWQLSFLPGAPKRPVRRRSRGDSQGTIADGSTGSRRSGSSRLLVVQTDPPRVDDLRLGARVVTVGRAPDNAVVINDPSASRYHAELHRKGGKWTLRDCGSVNGTRVNGKRVRNQVLEPGDRLMFGHVVAYFVGSQKRSRRGR